MVHALHFTDREIDIFKAALVVFETESEIAIHEGGFICEDADYTNNLLTLVQTLEEVKELQQVIETVRS